VAVEKTHFIQNILSASGIRFVVLKSISAVSNSGIIPILIVAVMGLGIAEGSGYIKALFITILGRFKSSGKVATILLLFFGVIANIAIDAGYIVLIPLGGMIFATAKRNPMLGVIVAFVGVSGGFAANFFLGGTDVILAAITTTAANAIIPGYVVSVESNYYFSIASSVVIIITGYIITEFILAKKYDKDFENQAHKADIEHVTPLQKKALKISNLVGLSIIILILVGVVPENGILRNADTKEVWKNSPFSSGIIFLTSLVFGMTGLVYGKITGSIKKAEDAIKTMAHFTATSSTSLISMIFAYQFLNMLEFSGIGMGLASLLTTGIRSLNVSGIPFMALVVIAVGFMNLFIGSNSVKWTAISYILVPVFVSFGYTPELAQAAYRIGDSTTNIISPVMVYMPIILGELQKYKKDANMGTLLAMTLPFTIGLLIAWISILAIFFMFNIPLGPNAPIFL
jgi:aminobenzoyl-glutamate transport protein